METVFAKCQRLLVKIGSGLLVDDNGGLRREWLNALAGEVAGLRAEGREVLIVSSGAIALGRGPLGISRSSTKLEELQAAAAIGQIQLANGWVTALAANGQTAAQLLLTSEDTEDRRRYLNALDTVRTLLARGVVPVINENDTVATDEIRYGDNDRLAARVAQMVDADGLVLLSDVDGLYDGPPSREGARLIENVDEVTPAIEAMAQTARSAFGSGGMQSKLAAAKIACASGCHVWVTNGLAPGALGRLAEGQRATHFVAAGKKGAARKRWIAAGLRPNGRVWLDDGAVAALRNGKSLLPVGVTRVEGDFQRGDLLALLDSADAEVARGLSACNSDDAQSMLLRHGERGKGSASGRSELVHRNDLALL